MTSSFWIADILPTGFLKRCFPWVQIFAPEFHIKRWNVTKQFYLSGQKGTDCHSSKPSPQSIRKCFELGLDKKPMKVRLIRVELDSGETEILVTSLTDMKKYPHEAFLRIVSSPLACGRGLQNIEIPTPRWKTFLANPCILSTRIFMQNCFQRTL